MNERDFSTLQKGDLGVSYSYNSDGLFGNRVNTKVGNRVLTLNEFAGGNGKLAKSTYGNGAYVSYGYDALGRVVSRSYNGAEAFRYLYANDGKLGKLVDRMAADPDHQGRVAAVSHCNCLERAFALKEQIEAKCQFQQVLILEAGGITTVYANDGGVVVAY